MFISPCLNHNYNSAHLSVRECREVKNGSSVPCVDAFRIALTVETEVIHSTETWAKPSAVHPIIILRYKALFILIRWKYRQGSEKSLHCFKQISCKYTNTCEKSEFATSSKSTGCQAVSKRCLIGLQKGVGKALKEHLLQANQASFRS